MKTSEAAHKTKTVNLNLIRVKTGWCYKFCTGQSIHSCLLEDKVHSAFNPWSNHPSAVLETWNRVDIFALFWRSAMVSVEFLDIEE